MTLSSGSTRGTLGLLTSFFEARTPSLHFGLSPFHSPPRSLCLEAIFGGSFKLCIQDVHMCTWAGLSFSVLCGEFMIASLEEFLAQWSASLFFMDCLWVQFTIKSIYQASSVGRHCHPNHQRWERHSKFVSYLNSSISPALGGTLPVGPSSVLCR